ncbi:MAG: hypothetical protein AABX89_06085 [Candidatus Thermoplasmatota archaeon]
MVWSRFAIPLFVVGLSGCLAGLDGLEQVTNQADQFAYGGSFSDKSGSKTFDWAMSGTIAAVNWGTANVESGSVRVTVKDDAGKTVYDGKLAKGGVTAAVADGVEGSGASKYSKPGAAGTWTVEVSFTDFTGLMGVSAQKKGKAYDSNAAASAPPT